MRRDEKGVVVNKHELPILAECHEKDADGNPIIEQGVNVDCNPAWRPQSRGEWWERRKGDVTVLFGWAVMVVLLSVGAPFWQDTLESLFGIKNLLRQKSGTENVEQESGKGQPKS